MNNQSFGAGLLFNSSNKNNSEQNQSPFIPVRVIDIILDDKNPNFKDQGGWDSIGTIQFRPIYLSNNENKDQFLFARPLLSNIKHYPLINEIVFLLFLPDKSTLNNNNGSFYYLDTINIWSSNHHNALPDVDNSSNYTENQKRDYIETANGASRRITDGSSEIKLGSTFEERSSVKSILPYEGDTIIEGRWGSSIRFGSTVKNSNIKNLWSSDGKNGDPIIIIRNNPHSDSKEGWIPLLEDINTDGSSIYFSSNQSIPIKVASNNQKSYGTNINNINNQNIILNDVSPNPPPSQTNNNLDQDLDQNAAEPPISPKIENIKPANTKSPSESDDMDFIIAGDTVENNAEKETEDNYFVPEDLDLSVPDNTDIDLKPSEKIKSYGFIRPAAGPITSKKEVRKDPTNPNRTESHGGVDIANKSGTPIYASASGKIVRANYSTSYGNVIIIYHEDKNVYSLYAHLSSILKGENTYVLQGTQIGKMGSTGKSTGPHLHFEIIDGTKYGNPDFYSKNFKLDPLAFI